MLEQKWTLVLVLLFIVVVSSLVKWKKQIQGQKTSLLQIIGAIARILIISLTIVVFVSLPLIDQPRISGKAILPLGIVLIIFGVILNVFVARELTRIKFKMEGLGIPERLITTGLFSLIRHPSSLGIISLMIGWYLAWGARYCIGFVAPIIIIGIFIENKLEDRNLEKIFGDEYRMYRKRVGMYLPKLRRYK